VEFIKKHNFDISQQGFSIKMYSKGLPHEPFFIALILKGDIIIRPTKKLLASYIVGDLAFLD